MDSDTQAGGTNQDELGCEVLQMRRARTHFHELSSVKSQRWELRTTFSQPKVPHDVTQQIWYMYDASGKPVR